MLLKRFTEVRLGSFGHFTHTVVKLWTRKPARFTAPNSVHVLKKIIYNFDCFENIRLKDCFFRRNKYLIFGNTPFTRFKTPSPCPTGTC